MLELMSDQVRKHAPLIHNMTNRVSINDCANILLACGASPIMAEAIEEVEEITAMCDGLVLNMGMPGRQKIEAMKKPESGQMHFIFRLSWIRLESVHQHFEEKQYPSC